MRLDSATTGLLALAIAATPSFVSAEEDGSAHVKAVQTLVAAYQADDRETWDAQFSKEIPPQVPEELWRSAGDLTQRFGKIEKVELGRWKPDVAGADVKVTFENATRELFVRMKDGKVSQLNYVPPTKGAH